MSELEHAADMLAWLTAMHRAAWAVVRAYEQSGSSRPEKIEGALLELERAREMLAAQLEPIRGPRRAGEGGMTLKQALAILAREQHNGHTRWDGTCPPSSAAWRTEFEVIAIAEAYERMRGPDPCAALRARVERIEAALRTLESKAVLFTKNGWWRCERCWAIYHINERFEHRANCPFAVLGHLDADVRLLGRGTVE